MTTSRLERDESLPSATFVHSLFRSGSTYIYNAIKRTNKFHVYHEPMHEVIESLPNSWTELLSRKDQLKSTLRHGFLLGNYFDEFSHLLPSIKKTFRAKYSFDLYFMDAIESAPELMAYIDILIDGAPKPPVLQCTRTCGRIGWLQENYDSKHVFLLRNPWDQWYSYKVDPYISITPRIIYSQINLPTVLKAVFEASGALPVFGGETREKITYGIRHPLPAEQDYWLFFGLWVYSYLCGTSSCDSFIDMDRLSVSKEYQQESLTKLEMIGLESIDFTDVQLHRTIFADRERVTFEFIEEQVLEIFRQFKISTAAVHEYLAEARSEAFVSINNIAPQTASVLEDAFRLRDLLTERDGQIASLTHSATERESQIANLAQSLTERDGQIASLTHSATERESQIANLAQTLTERDRKITSLIQLTSQRETTIDDLIGSISWKVTAPLRKAGALLKSVSRASPSSSNKGQEVARGPSAFFTICSKNFLAHARALHGSINPHYPGSRFFVVLCDQVDGAFDPAREPFELIYLEELELPSLAEMANRYNITEFNTAVKPFAFMHIMGSLELSSVVYLDPDLFFVDRMHEIDQLLDDGAEAVLTPHILQPAENDQIHDQKMLQFGIYNLGFLALRNTPTVLAFLRWWGRRLEKDCVIRLEDGLFVDQKWADLLPAFVPGTRILHHPGYNVAYWNLPQRKITRKPNGWFVNNLPLRFVHFSGNKLDDVQIFSRHSQQVTIESIGDLRDLLTTYRHEVYNQGHEFYRSLPYAYNWNGASGINLHTPKELDLAPKEKSATELFDRNIQNGAPKKENILNLRQRYILLRQAIPIALRLTGGWTSLVRGTWQSFRLYGWNHVKQMVVELAGYTPPPNVPLLNDTSQKISDGDKLKKLLYLDWAIPKPDKDAASVTAALLLQIFDSIGYKATFVPCGLKYEEGYYEDLIAANIDVVVYPAIQSVKEWLEANAANYDVCVMARGPVAWPYLETIKACAPNLRLIFNTVDLHFLRELRQAELMNDESARQAALVLRDQELELIDKCDLTILLSNDELYTVREHRPEAPLTILPVVFKDIPGAAQGYEQRRDILFIGSFPHKPNIDAVVYFAESVFPIIKLQIPDIRFKVIGANPPEEIQRLAAIPGIEIVGFVKDLEPVFTDIRLTVAPLRYGAGIKGKIGTSLCYGVPCVATPMAVEGMGLTPGLNVLVGESPEAFASAVSDAYQNAGLWKTLSVEGQKFALESYSIDVIQERVRNLLGAVNNGWRTIHNVVELGDWEGFKKHATKIEREYERRVLREQALLPNDGSEGFRTAGFCCVCGTHTRFLTSFMYSTDNTPDGRPMPNWREHMQCEHCGLVNRMRAALNVLHTYAAPEIGSQIYVTERLTKTYQWLSERYPMLQGSEYFGPSHQPGSSINGIRHEDVMNLSFAEGSFDRILSFDVLEHVPDPYRAVREFYRVLKPGGVLIFSVPFSSDSAADIIRATLEEDGTIIHHMPAEYHGNPVDPEGGALCFRYFGWEALDNLRSIGFTNVRCLAYWSEEQGYLGREQYIFKATHGGGHGK
jgi:glycosyltransferase involved in cell wall biosynthesis